MKRHFITLLLVAITGVAPLYGQSKTKTDLSYHLDKKDKTKKKDAVDSIYTKLDVKIDKSQFDTPQGILVMLKDKKDSTIFSYGVGKDVISGAKHDTTGCISIGKNEFIFHLDSILLSDYLLQFRILQENGDVFVVDKKVKL